MDTAEPVIMSGTLNRCGSDIESVAALVADGRQKLKGFFRRGLVPHAHRFDLELLIGESLANAGFYGTGDTVGYRFVARPSGATLFITYSTEPFNDNPAPDTCEPGNIVGLKETGRGIQIMRSICSEILFRFVPGGVIVAMQTEWGAEVD